MQVIKPTPSQAAFVLKKFMLELGIEVQLAKAQEAVARINGYANWNSLTSDVDPRGGDPAGLLQKLDEQSYELRGESQATVFIDVKNIRVSVKHEDEGVVVDVFSKEGVQHGEESLGSTWVTFDEAEYAPDEAPKNQPQRSPDESAVPHAHQLLHELLIAWRLRTLDTLGPVQFVMDGTLLREVLAGDIDFEPGRTALWFQENREYRTVPIESLLSATRLSTGEWELPGELTLRLYQENVAKDESRHPGESSACFEAGDKVYVRTQYKLATVLDVYGDGVNGAHGDIRLDLCGNTPVSDIEHYDSTKHAAFDHTFVPVKKEWLERYGIAKHVPLRDE